MDAPQQTTGTTEAPKGAGFPPFDTTTFPGQFVWLAITFAFLFVVLWRVAGPRIQGAIAARQGSIRGDLAKAEAHRKDAAAAQAAYETALADARKRAHALADENRKRVQSELDGAKATAEAAAQKTTAAAETRIRATRDAALAQVARTAEDATIAIVAHLTGDTVSPQDARAALAN
jgi:F-type H+-transporting ATPase subunit b